MPDISDAEYRDFQRSKSDLVLANEKIWKLESTAENTKTALKAHRETEKGLKENISTLEWENETFKNDVEEKYKDFDAMKDSSDKWGQHEKKISDDRKASIEEMKTTLWDDFNDGVKSFIDGLDDWKVETYLKWLIPEDTDDKDKKKSPNLKTGDDKNKKKDLSDTDKRLTALTKKKEGNLLSPTEKLEFLTLTSKVEDSSDDEWDE